MIQWEVEAGGSKVLDDPRLLKPRLHETLFPKAIISYLLVCESLTDYGTDFCFDFFSFLVRLGMDSGPCAF